jgi:hypothetical protein
VKHLALALLLAWPAAGKAEAPASRPLVSVLGTCSALSASTYPADMVNWFDPAKQAQVVFYAHLLFPLKADTQWQVPLVLTPSAWADLPAPPFVDEFYAEAYWQDPDGKPIALYGLTFAARTTSDYVRLHGKVYSPHTFAMAIGTRDLRVEAGQVHLPDKVGQYTVRFNVDGQPVGLGFFRMLKGQATQASQPAAAALSPSAGAAPAAGKPTPLPTIAIPLPEIPKPVWP